MTKNMKYSQALRAYRMGCEQVADAFVKHYFPGEDWCWLADRIGGSILVDGGFQIMLDSMLEAIELLPHIEQINAWYEYIYHTDEVITLREFLTLKLKP